tara:strand:- start:571 stop:777 length:207 start_codon:yes stop_codon:yes gene_type:complete
MIHKIQLVEGATDTLLAKKKAKKVKRIKVNYQLSETTLKDMKRRSGLIGNSYSTQQVFDEYIKITINE